jgi:hypothetical protein
MAHRFWTQANAVVIRNASSNLKLKDCFTSETFMKQMQTQRSQKMKLMGENSHFMRFQK